MPLGNGPKLVIDVGVDLKRRLHGRLALEGRTVKSWVKERIETYLGGPEQLDLYSPSLAPRRAATTVVSLRGASSSVPRAIPTREPIPKKPNLRSGRKVGRSTKTSRSGV